MTQNVRLWEVNGEGELAEINKTRLATEKQLEDWLEADINVLGEDLLVIGRQVETDYGHYLDFLCINSDGDLVVVELKRDRTPRDVTAQAIDYASWVENLSEDRVVEIANDYLRSNAQGPLDVAFNKRFQSDVPETINESHSMLIVASDVDSSTQRIIQYLSSKGIGINFATFEHFTDSTGKELMSRVFMIEREEISVRVNTRTSGRRKITTAQLEEHARENGVHSHFVKFESKALNIFERKGRTKIGRTFGATTEHGRQTIMSVLPADSNEKDGLSYQVYTQRLADFLMADVEQILNCFPKTPDYWAGYWESADDYRGHTGYFTIADEVDGFFSALETLKTN